MRITRPIDVQLEDEMSTSKYPWDGMAEQIVYATTFARHFEWSPQRGLSGRDAEAAKAHGFAREAVEAFRAYAKAP